MKDVPQLKSRLAALFAEQYFAVLATRTGDHIHTALVAFAAGENLKTIFVCTPRATRKYANLKRNPSVSLMVHNSSNLATDIRQAIAVTVSGTAEEVPAGRLEDARTVYLAKQPHMSGFANSPNTAIIEVTVKRYDVVVRFQDVTILEIQEDRIVSL
ncbi:pyridoxamine 5'-phosphate oxidase family protein [Desulfosarcina sp.]|uniref:pyridoxamine 5'-phosphate oxidase family protein n=1 Tax=Desulfosarcina sp. TaxID=2027861 RepID=UPI003970EBD9